MIIRFDTSSSRIDTATINNAYIYYDFNVLAISHQEVFFSYRDADSQIHHMAKGYYGLYNEFGYILNISIQLTMTVNQYVNSESRLAETEDTLWHAINIDGNIVFFHINHYGFSLIGSKRILSGSTRHIGVEVEVGQGVVCILSDDYGKFFFIVNATTQDLIQVYDIDTPNIIFNFILRNGYINIIG